MLPIGLVNQLVCLLESHILLLVTMKSIIGRQFGRMKLALSPEDTKPEHLLLAQRSCRHLVGSSCRIKG